MARSSGPLGLAALVLSLSAACGSSVSTPTASLVPSFPDTVAPVPPSVLDTISPAPVSVPDTASPAPTAAPVTNPEPYSVPPTASPAPLDTELVGNWEVNSGTDSTGSQQIWRFYEFTADGQYDYKLGLCRSKTDCTYPDHEAGYAQTANGRLTLTPQTGSQQGPQTWPYVVDRDPVVGDVRLVLTLPDGQMDIFYRP